MHDLPGVGKNLQDHIDYVQTWRVPSHTDTFGVSLRGSARVTGAMLEWRASAPGMVTSHRHLRGLLPLRTRGGVPDLQLVFVLGIVDDHARKMHRATASRATSMCCARTAAAPSAWPAPTRTMPR
jgi:choline dehydrogenase-like flavoprotein